MAVAQPLTIDVEITGTCQTCKHWNTDNGIIPAAFINVGAKCDLLSDKIVDTSDGYKTSSPYVETPGDFGCNQHEPKETEAAKENH